MLCGKQIRTTENCLLPCLCESGHAGGCNPFSANPNIIQPTVSTPGNEKPVSPTFQGESRAEFEHDRFGTAGPIKEEKPKEKYMCFWQGAHGRCVLELGHWPETPHKEDYSKPE